MATHKGQESEEPTEKESSIEPNKTSETSETEGLPDFMPNTHWRRVGLKYLNYKSPEQLADEQTKREEEQAKREAEYQKSREEYKKWLDDSIKNCDKAEGMKFALKHLEKPDKVAKHIEGKSKDYYETYRNLTRLAFSLRHRAELVDDRVRYFEKPDLSFMTEPFRSVMSQSKRKQITSSREGDELRKLADELDGRAKGYFNRRKELGDDDPDATPLTLFTVRRLKKFLPNLPDDKARYAYLLKLKTAFLQQDERGFAFVRGVKQLKADKDFGLHLETQINLYKEIVGQTQEKPSVSRSNRIQERQRNRF